ncbi:hypothetical protein ACXIUT_19890 [Achromobacter denitrificans]
MAVSRALFPVACMPRKLAVRSQVENKRVNFGRLHLRGCGLVRSTNVCLNEGVLMVTKIFPGGVLRGYFLDSEIYKSRDDEEYYLCFGTTGEMFVLVYFSPNKQYSRGGWSSERIQPSDFHKHVVDGTPLATLVADKLQAIQSEAAPRGD